MSQTTKRLTKNVAESLFDQMDSEKQGFLNLENMKRLYDPLQADYKDLIREKLRKFVIDNQRFIITKSEFLSIFLKSFIPCVHINLGHIKEISRIRELTPTELRNVISKRIENKAVSSHKPKFIKKNRSSTKSFTKLDSEKFGKNQENYVRRKGYFSSLS